MTLTRRRRLAKVNPRQNHARKEENASSDRLYTAVNSNVEERVRRLGQLTPPHPGGYPLAIVTGAHDYTQLQVQAAQSHYMTSSTYTSENPAWINRQVSSYFHINFMLLRFLQHGSLVLQYPGFCRTEHRFSGWKRLFMKAQRRLHVQIGNRPQKDIRMNAAKTSG